MISPVEMSNMALAHIQSGKEISNLTTERSVEAITCRMFYPITIRAVLRDGRWPFATRVQALELVEEDPNPHWAYSYRYPSECLFFRKILSGIRNETLQSKVPHRILSDQQGRLIFTDRQDAVAEWTKNITDSTLFPPDFELAASFRLAAYIAPKLARDQIGLSTDMMLKYRFELGIAMANAFNEEQHEDAPRSELERARD